MKEILPINHGKMTHSYRTNNLSNLLSKTNDNIEEIVNIINNNMTSNERKNIFGVSGKITALELAKFIKQSHSGLRIKKMQDIVNIINNNKRSSENLSIARSKPITIKELIRMIDGCTKYQNDTKTNKISIPKTAAITLEAKPVNVHLELVSGNVVSLNEVGAE